MATNMFTKTIVFILLFTICQGAATAEINGQTLLEETNADAATNSEVREKYSPELEIIQTRNHRIQNSIPNNQRRHSKSKRRMKKRYKCHLCERPQCDHPLDEQPICENALQCWKSRVRDAFGEETVSRGCVDAHDHLLFYCNNQGRQHKKRDTSGQYNIECCYGDFCNNGSFPELPPLITKDEEATRINSKQNSLRLVAAILGPICICVCVFLGLYFMRRTQHKRMVPSRTKHDTYINTHGDELRITSAGDSTLKEYIPYSMTSGSGGGMTLLTQTTPAKQVTLLNCIGQGRYGGVYRGIWQGQEVAVKRFSSRDEESWKRETEIYTTISFCFHESILGFKTSDIRSYNSSTELWVLTDFYPLGSLYDHLHRSPLSHHEMALICMSIASGLVHLHSEIRGTANIKPAIAHRDLKSKNILVRGNGTCVIADFGLAVMERPNGQLDIGTNPRIGTKRYMSPEILDQSINLNCFESLRRADIYSFGLILWEVCRRTISGGIFEEYKIPYDDVVPSDPDFEHMKKVVVIDNYRPQIPNRWSSDSLLSGMAKLIRECWHQNPNVRLSALRVKKTLQKLATADNDVKINYDGEIYV